MAPRFEIHSVENTGPTDNGGDDSLWIVWMGEPGREHERFLVSLANRCAVPTEEQMRNLIARRADGLANDESALDQFREREIAHPNEHPTRRAIILRAGSG